MTKKRFFSLIGFPLFFILLSAAGFFFQDHLLLVFRDADLFRARVADAGLKGPFLFVGLQFVQVIVFIIPGEIPQIAGGYLFGVIGGTLLSLTGIMAGSAVNFFLGRWLGRPFVEAVIGKPQTERFEGVIASERAQTGFFLFFLIPGIPKDALCYLGGLSKIGFFPFIIISMLGRFPAMLGSSLIGSAAAQRNWILLTVASIVVVIVVAAGFLHRDKLHKWIDKLR